MKKISRPAFSPLSLNAIVPSGWYKRQLEIQAAGLSGHLDELWPDIYDSQWLGGSSEGWERLPYWLDGFIPLAALLRDELLLARARKYIDAILAHQQEDGWLCPTRTQKERERYDMWALFLLLKVLVVWHDATGDARVEEAVYRALVSLDCHIDHSTLFNWAQTRWFECLIPIFWLYEHRPEPWIWDLAVKLHAQGFDWESFFTTWPMESPNPQGRWSQMNHVVNNAMMLKSSVLWSRMFGEASGGDVAAQMLAQLDTHHGMINGMFSGDECLAGLSPSQGTELCAVVEAMYSLQLLLGTGEAAWGDRLERIAYNALPAAMTPDMWAHQYDQQVNQPFAGVMENPPYTTNSPDANIFGFEPCYGCCTANFSQGWPKFAQSLVMSAEDGIAITAWAPVAVKTTVQGVAVTLEIITDYPFREDVKVRVRAERPVEFALYLRIPGWAEDASVDGEGVCAGQYHQIRRSWDSATLALRFPMPHALVSRPEGRAALVRGPLVYSVKLSENVQEIPGTVSYHKPPHANYQISTDAPYEYSWIRTSDFHFHEVPIGEYPFSPEGAPMMCRAKCVGPKCTADIELIPYGCTNIRMTEMEISLGAPLNRD